MGDFGHGYGLYFSSLRSFAILALLAGIINIPNLMYYGSTDYDPTKGDENLALFIHTSAVCTCTSMLCIFFIFFLEALLILLSR